MTRFVLACFTVAQISTALGELGGKLASLLPGASDAPARPSDAEVIAALRSAGVPVLIKEANEE